MTGFIIAIHVIICTLLIIIILIQAGRGGGLVESFSGVESMFGTKTNAFLTRTTTVLSILFFLTCLTLAVISLKQSRSLMETVRPVSRHAQPQEKPLNQATTTPPTQEPVANAKAQTPATQEPTVNTKVQAPASQEPTANTQAQASAAQENPQSAPKAK
ncbi:MAG: preprotein translocase subunit SecG [Candidatus Omnitrophica bacterium]|nr:preprotein translocase subunit SecG [Candidatus Omnitrophota bacterium]